MLCRNLHRYVMFFPKMKNLHLWFLMTNSTNLWSCPICEAWADKSDNKVLLHTRPYAKLSTCLIADENALLCLWELIRNGSWILWYKWGEKRSYECEDYFHTIHPCTRVLDGLLWLYIIVILLICFCIGVSVPLIVLIVLERRRQIRFEDYSESKEITRMLTFDIFFPSMAHFDKKIKMMRPSWAGLWSALYHNNLWLLQTWFSAWFCSFCGGFCGAGATTILLCSLKKFPWAL